MEKEKIPSHKYVATRWLKLQGFGSEEMKDMVAKIQNTTQFDGFDDETGDLCLTFNDYKPRRIEEIRICKFKNEQTASHRMKLIKQIVTKKYPNIYFNLNRLVIKKLR